MTPGKLAQEDQYRAAVADVRRRIFKTAEATGSRVSQTDAAWIKARFQDLGRTIAEGRAFSCPHIGPSPTVLHTAAWSTDRLVCSDCTGRLDPKPSGDVRCARCGDPGADQTGHAAHGLVLMVYRLCGTCAQVAPRPPD